MNGIIRIYWVDWWVIDRHPRNGGDDGGFGWGGVVGMLR